MKRITIILLSFLISLGIYAQKVGSGSAHSARMKIPGSDEQLIGTRIHTIERDSASSKEGITGMGGYYSAIVASPFIESELNPGYPAGWITNSEGPILKRNEKGVSYIELGEEKGQYMGKLLEINPESSNEFILCYHADSSMLLTIMQFDEENRMLTEKRDIILPEGTNIKTAFALELTEQAERILLRIEKHNHGVFQLLSFSIN